jgi:hypothetical protein
MLPPEMHDWESYVARFEEPSFRSATAANGYRRRLRLFLAPPRTQGVAVRIDTDVSGRITGYFIRVEWRRDEQAWVVSDYRRFAVTETDMAALDHLIEVSRLWTFNPEVWTSKDVCVGGGELIMERLTPDGDRVSEANTICTAPKAMLDVAAKMITMADPGDRQVAGWLN